jgi:hypothetical protein
VARRGLERGGVEEEEEEIEEEEEEEEEAIPWDREFAMKTARARVSSRCCLSVLLSKNC